MSVSVSRNDDGTFCLLRDGSAINEKSYYKINRLNDNSNYYQLWPNEKCFYLYNQLNGKFARNSQTDLDADLFREIRHYSQRTKSFAAYRSDSSQAHLFYEDGDTPRDVFIEIGAESNDDCCSRPVKYIYNGYRWCFYETEGKRFAWPKDFGYPLNDDRSLCSRFMNGFFTVYNSDGQVYQLAFYDRDNHYPYVITNADGTRATRQGHIYFFKNTFDLIQPQGKYLICKTKNGVYYVYDTLAREKNKRICTSVDEPIFSNDLLFISSELSKQVFFLNDGKTIENVAWKRGCEIKAYRGYAFVKNPNENNWNIYNLQDGHEVYTDLTIEEVELKRDNVLCIAHDRNGTNGRYNLEDIKNANRQWLERIIALNEQQVPAETSNTTIEEAKHEVDSSVSDFPDHIDFVISAKATIRVNAPNIIILTRKASQLQPNDIIFLYDDNRNESFVVRYLHKSYRILFSKQHEQPLEFAASLPTSFTSCHIDGLTQNNYVEKIKNAIVDNDTRRCYISIENKQRAITSFLKKNGFEDNVIQQALHVLLPDYFEKQKEIQEHSKARFIFKDNEYLLLPDEEWPVDNPFEKKQFLEKKDYVAVLVESNFGFKTGSEVPGAHYEMKGQGKDPKEDQVYEGYGRLSINGIIRDKKKRVLLFMRKNNKIVFFDEVECVSSCEEREYYGDNYRIIIKFFLRSKIREFTK